MIADLIILLGSVGVVWLAFRPYENIHEDGCACARCEESKP